ncbi:RelA/SpoT domain-containing protein [Vibrio alginolyticus]|uniref:RelA/SpoT domain-containing protein n=1 Tax=Vibrio diabolicus TaxID=50719 RepID=UPI00215ECF8D|nr:RelA/SpoT domain-containing protein [Vibrio diabolicus]EGQ8449467.1 GTP pyrophosphokinase [Vibrio alginolyticus]ELP9500289.1 RelA/SpoT domain-containing protein [Vibrio alginolyticus]MCS0415866.1 RelA/SpoT domain-containing protein [Vibrio diabolicus]
MASNAYKNQKKDLKHTKSSINKAADLIRKGCEDPKVKVDAIKKIQNFREAHLYPLMLMKNHLVRTARKVDKNVIVARRLKRLDTIIDKLERPTLDGASGNSIKLTRMQDIGGCRAIVKNLSTLRLLEKKLLASRSVHQVIRTQNYLDPKPSGYGGVHLIYSCFENQDDTSPTNQYKKLKIEIQLRTQLHHAWATSLEIVDLVKGYNLKTSLVGNDSWRNFFSHAGRLVAAHEGAIELSESEAYGSRLNMIYAMENTSVLSVLARGTLAIQTASDDRIRKRLPKNHTSNGLYLVKFWSGPLNKEGEETIRSNVYHYNSKLTNAALEDLEESESDSSVKLAVLVSSENLNNLRKAYPNYFGSSTEFIAFLKAEIRLFLKQTKLDGNILTNPHGTVELNEDELAIHLKLVKVLTARSS